MGGTIGAPTKYAKGNIAGELAILTGLTSGHILIVIGGLYGYTFCADVIEGVPGLQNVVSYGGSNNHYNPIIIDGDLPNQFLNYIKYSNGTLYVKHAMDADEIRAYYWGV